MKFKIEDGHSDDSFIVEGQTDELCAEQINIEIHLRNWSDCVIRILEN